MNKFLEKVGPILLTVLGIVLTLFLWKITKNDRDMAVLHSVGTEATVIKKIIEFRFEKQIESLTRMAERWTVADLPSREVWEKDAENYLKHDEIYKAISWVSKNFHVKWIVPLKGNEAAIGFNLGSEARRLESLLKARDTGRVATTQPISLVQGGKGFVAQLPIFHKQKFVGYIGAVFLIDKVVSSTIDSLNLSSIIDFSLKDKATNETLYETANYSINPSKDMEHQVSFQIGDTIWNGFFRPTPKLVAETDQILPLLILFCGILVSFLAGLTYWQYLSIRRKAVMLEESNKRADYEMNKAKKANSAKSNFLANMSHEIRTPLASILGFTELMNSPEATDSDRVKYSLRISNSAKHLKALVDGVLDLTKIESENVEPEKVHISLTKELKEVLDLFRIRAEAKGLQFQVEYENEPPDRVLTDPTMFRQIMENVISNAIKFTESGTINVNLATTPSGEDPDEGLLKITVKDTGLGISEKEAEKLFQPFVQADSSITRKYGGTGLGLALSKKLAQVLGGDVTLLESAPGFGSSFLITVNVGKAKKTRFLPEKVRSGNLSQEVGRGLSKGQFLKLKVLITEDDPDLRELYREYFKSFGVFPEFAVDGEEGLHKARLSKYDIIFMDIQLPKMNGDKVVKKLRADGVEIPIIALTARALKEEHDEFLVSGFTDCLTKPFNLNELIDVIVSSTHLVYPLMENTMDRTGNVNPAGQATT